MLDRRDRERFPKRPRPLAPERRLDPLAKRDAGAGEHGRHERRRRARVVELAPGATYVDVGGAGHMVAGDKNDAFCVAILDFLTDREAA